MPIYAPKNVTSYAFKCFIDHDFFFKFSSGKIYLILIIYLTSTCRHKISIVWTWTPVFGLTLSLYYHLIQFSIFTIFREGMGNIITEFCIIYS